MTNPSRLKILGISLVLVGLTVYLLLELHVHPLWGADAFRGDVMFFIKLGGWLLAIIGLGC